MTVARPALADVLATLTTNAAGQYDLARWHTRDLWPWPTQGDDAPWWDLTSARLRNVRSQTPPDISAVVAVSSLGVTTLATVAALVGEVQPGAVVVWRVMSREALRDHTEIAAHAAWGYVSETVRASAHLARGDGASTFATRAVIALHESDVRLLECGRERVVIGVEAVA